jgi:hypothetical protein
LGRIASDEHEANFHEGIQLLPIDFALERFSTVFRSCEQLASVSIAVSNHDNHNNRDCHNHPNKQTHNYH